MITIDIMKIHSRHRCGTTRTAPTGARAASTRDLPPRVAVVSGTMRPRWLMVAGGGWWWLVVASGGCLLGGGW